MKFAPCILLSNEMVTCAGINNNDDDDQYDDG